MINTIFTMVSKSSIKKVLPTLSAELRYDMLGIRSRTTSLMLGGDGIARYCQ